MGSDRSEWGSSGEFDLGSDLLCVAGADGRFVSMSAAWERLLGWSREELQARPFIEFVHPDDVQHTIAARARVAGPDAEIPDLVNRYRTRDGGYRWLRWSTRSDGESWFGVARDVTERQEREERLRQILREENLLAYSQPILDQRRMRISHEELLVRLRPPGGEVMQPAEFLPDAERLGLISIVDCWMLRQGLRMAGLGRATTVNVSSRSIDEPEVLRELCETVEAAPHAARNLVFEITETAALDHIDAALDLIERVEPLGCRFALDDFGTGYGSLTHLRRLPVHYLKIDRSFVRGVTRNPADQALVRSVVAIASELGLRTVAEGVEDGATLELLREYAVDHVQGFLIGVPEPLLH